MRHQLIAALLRCLPASFREEFGAEMRDVIEADLHAARVRRGRRGAIHVWWRTACGLVSLAAVGIYGIISTAVRARTQEIAVRVALGADRSRVLRMIVFEGMRLALAGAALGLAGSLAVSRSMGAVLYEVQPADPVALAVGTGTLLMVAAAACAWPALRAVRLNPAVALRAD